MKSCIARVIRAQIKEVALWEYIWASGAPIQSSGGKQPSEDDLHIMLTGRPASSPSSVAPRADNIPSAKRSKPQRAKVKKVETPKPEKEDETPSLYNKEDTRNPAGKMEPQIDNQDMKEQPNSDDGGYKFSGEDDAMLHDAMAAFMNL